MCFELYDVEVQEELEDFFYNLPTHDKVQSEMKLKIREVRKKRNLTQIELAKLTGISKSSISRYEREDLWPDMLEMEWIALAMDVKITDLFDSEVK